MLFNSASFVLFFLVFFILYYFAARTRDLKLWCITLASLFFYATFDYRFVPLLLGTALVDFFIARSIASHEGNKPYQKKLLWTSVVLNLGMLAFFKYVNFFLDASFGLLHTFGVKHPTPVLNILLPVGISFYTFQSMSYTIDVYRGELAARQRPIEFLAAITFFPHLLMGPIIRASTLLPQFETLRPSSPEEAKRAVRLIAIGLLNKSIADLMGPTVDDFFANPSATHSALESWTAAIGFLGQVYGDFAGYSTMAIGIALLIGFKVPRNFDLPYISASIGEFWRRWHLSLSFWFRDYVFLPLALRQRGRPYRSTIFTMTLVGFWHGASWPCIAYGGYHGALVALYNFSKAPRKGRFGAFARRFAATKSMWLKVLKIAFTLYLVVLGEVIFRATSLEQGLKVVRDLHWSANASVFSYRSVVAFALIVLGTVFGHLLSALETEKENTGLAAILRNPFVLWPGVVVAVSVATLLGGTGKAFIYFQF